VIVVAIFYRDQSLFQRLDVAAFFAREFLPGWTLLSFRERGQIVSASRRASIT
jgi:hypothetical protein